MNAVSTPEIEQVAMAEESLTDSVMLERAQIYHFLELALAHPGEEGHEFFRKETTSYMFLLQFAELLQSAGETCATGLVSANKFFELVQRMNYEEVEAAHISLFSSNYPHLPCPPYGSLFTAVDSEKRLEEMLAIKEFYHRNGIDIADAYDDLPDHICVELEFMQVLCFREHEATQAGDLAVIAGLRATQAEFLARFLMPFATRLAEIGIQSAPENPYSHLLEVMRCFITQHRDELVLMTASSPSDQEVES